jgi:hypothetical protein
MTRRANPKPRWLRYEGKDGYVNERADAKAKALARHIENVKDQQRAGLESQAVRNRLPVRKRKKASTAPDITDFGPPRRRPGRMKVRPASRPAQAVYRPYDHHNRSWAHSAKYYKPTYAGMSASR